MFSVNKKFNQQGRTSMKVLAALGILYISQIHITNQVQVQTQVQNFDETSSQDLLGHQMNMIDSDVEQLNREQALLNLRIDSFIDQETKQTQQEAKKAAKAAKESKQRPKKGHKRKHKKRKHKKLRGKEQLSVKTELVSNDFFTQEAKRRTIEAIKAEMGLVANEQKDQELSQKTDEVTELKIMPDNYPFSQDQLLSDEKTQNNQENSFDTPSQSSFDYKKESYIKPKKEKKHKKKIVPDVRTANLIAQAIVHQQQLQAGVSEEEISKTTSESSQPFLSQDEKSQTNQANLYAQNNQENSSELGSILSEQNKKEFDIFRTPIVTKDELIAGNHIAPLSAAEKSAKDNAVAKTLALLNQKQHKEKVFEFSADQPPILPSPSPVELPIYTPITKNVQVSSKPVELKKKDEDDLNSAENKVQDEDILEDMFDVEKRQKRAQMRAKQAVQSGEKIQQKPIIKVAKIMADDRDPYSYTEEAPQLPQTEKSSVDIIHEQLQQQQKQDVIKSQPQQIKKSKPLNQQKKEDIVKKTLAAIKARQNPPVPTLEKVTKQVEILKAKEASVVTKTVLQKKEEVKKIGGFEIVSDSLDADEEFSQRVPPELKAEREMKNKEKPIPVIVPVQEEKKLTQKKVDEAPKFKIETTSWESDEPVADPRQQLEKKPVQKVPLVEVKEKKLIQKKTDTAPAFQIEETVATPEMFGNLMADEQIKPAEKPIEAPSSVLHKESDYHRKAPDGVFESHPEPVREVKAQVEKKPDQKPVKVAEVQKEKVEMQPKEVIADALSGLFGTEESTEVASAPKSESDLKVGIQKIVASIQPALQQLIGKGSKAKVQVIIQDDEQEKVKQQAKPVAQPVSPKPTVAAPSAASLQDKLRQQAVEKTIALAREQAKNKKPEPQTAYQLAVQKTLKKVRAINQGFVNVQTTEDLSLNNVTPVQEAVQAPVQNTAVVDQSVNQPTQTTFEVAVQAPAQGSIEVSIISVPDSSVTPVVSPYVGPSSMTTPVHAPVLKKVEPLKPILMKKSAESSSVSNVTNTQQVNSTISNKLNSESNKTQAANKTIIKATIPQEIKVNKTIAPKEQKVNQTFQQSINSTASAITQALNTNNQISATLNQLNLTISSPLVKSIQPIKNQSTKAIQLNKTQQTNNTQSVAIQQNKSQANQTVILSPIKTQKAHVKSLVDQLKESMSPVEITNNQTLSSIVQAAIATTPKEVIKSVNANASIVKSIDQLVQEDINHLQNKKN